MIHSITTDIDTVLTVSFADENVDLTQSIKVDGNEQAALSYLPFFERDLRREHADLFPQSKGVIE